VLVAAVAGEELLEDAADAGKNPFHPRPALVSRNPPCRARGAAGESGWPSGLHAALDRLEADERIGCFAVDR
jgi:hypothetical protein